MSTGQHLRLPASLDNPTVAMLVGTRPEAVKIAPVAIALRRHPRLRPMVVHTGQHEHIVAPALAPFGLTPDLEFTVRRATGGQAELLAALLPRLDAMLLHHQPAAVLVQGDTTTTLAGALAAFWRGIPVAHLEAGLRTGNLDLPFPEEGNRQMISRIASLHLAPTQAAADVLHTEHVPRSRIVVTGNTVVDAVRYMAATRKDPAHSNSEQLNQLETAVADCDGRLLLVTMHRRETWGRPLARVLEAIRELVRLREDCFVLMPAHPNPRVARQVRHALDGHPRISVTDSLDYPDLVRVLERATLVITDSGGLQEEAPTFGVPVLVAREVTERMESVHAGFSHLVGTDPQRIVAKALPLLDARTRLPLERNPYGDGNAAGRVVRELDDLLGPAVRQDTKPPLGDLRMASLAPPLIELRAPAKAHD
jgi:UDP-N-acetylglucosamine 2-epimerase (non-hydrolysing)